MKIDWKKIAPYAAIIGIFIVASVIYFWPAVEGKIIYSGDGINGRAAAEESIAFHEQTGEYTYWTNSMFGGMPNYQIGGNGGYMVDKIMKPIRWFFSWGNRNAVFIFLFYLCAFFVLLHSFKINKWLSLAGAFATALSSYFFVVIAAMHHGKCYSITWMTLVIVGFILIYRKQYGWGALLVMFFTYIGFFLHPQMSYYICMLIGVLFFAELAISIRDKEWKHWLIATCVFATSFIIGLGTGSANIFVNKEYVKETMRGGHSDLVKVTDENNKTEGLNLDYATAWSYGKAETMTFLIPNYMGGASGYNVGEESVLYNELVKARVPRSTAKQFCQSAPTYWGEKAFTSGPVYIGAIVCLLFLLGLLIVPGPYKWALLFATLMSIFLAWGKNMMWLTELFFRYFPEYNKFRAVESILIVAEITMPLLGFMGLQQLIEHKEDDKKNSLYILIAGGVTAFICLIFALFGSSICSFTSSYDNAWKGQVGNEIYQMIIDQRAAMLKADAWRSLGFVVAATILLYAYTKKNFKTLYLGLGLTALVILDMWAVDKRFCNDSYFRPKKNVYNAFNMRPVEKLLKDSDNGYYRVLDLSANTFNDARLSYHFHSIGGYSAAKLRRYQDLIEEHISKMNWNVLNMLNTKYIIAQGQNGQLYPHPNRDAYGACWMADDILWVNNANDESNAMNQLDLKHHIVADSSFALNKSLLDMHFEAPTSVDTFTMETYQPNQLRYRSNTTGQRLAVLSEIYYPYGWKATIDGKETTIYRVNYMLRAIILPEGEHQLVLRFEPDSIRKGNILSLCCFAIMLLTFACVVGWQLYSQRKRAA